MTILVPIDRIDPNPWQTRFGDPDPEYIKALALDIAANGLLQSPAGRIAGCPESVSHSDQVQILANFPEAKVQLAFGHHRLSAYRWLNDVKNTSNLEGDYSSIPVEIALYTDEQMAILAWSENEKRRDVTPIERAKAIEQRMESFGWTQAQVAEKLGVSRPVISNALRLLGLPEDVQTALTAGTISERVGLALVALQDIPEEILKKAEQSYNHNSKPTVIIQEALNGELTSDKIRDRINYIYGSYCKRLDDSVFGLDTMQADAEIHAPTCRDCDARIKDRNLCPLANCYERKTWLFEQSYLERASEVSGIIPLTVHKGDYELTTFGWQHADKLPAVKAAKCENLRLKYKPGKKAGEKDSVDGYPNAQIVCVKQERFCTCIKGLEHAGQVNRAPAPQSQQLPAGYSYEPDPDVDTSYSYSTAELSDLAKEAKLQKQENLLLARDLMEKAGEQIAVGLASKTLATWKFIANAVDYGLGMDMENVWDIQVAIGKKIIDINLTWERTDIDRVLEDLNELLADSGLEPLEDPRPPVPAAEPAPMPVGKTLSEVFEAEENQP